jgi:hypothetical protein
MKERTKNILGYGALLSGALLLGCAMMAGIYSQYLKSIASPMDDAKNKRFNESLIRYTEQLQISNNPRDLVAAALFLDFQDMLKVPEPLAKPMHIEQVRRAIALSPKDADIAWLEAMGCGRLQAACDVEDALTRLRIIEPDNLAVHMLAFNRADKAGNAELRKSALQTMANSRYSDIHYSSVGNMFFEAFRGWHSPMPISAADMFGDDINQTPVTDDESRKVVAMGYSMAMGLPALQQITTYCKTEKLPMDELQYCQKIATVMIKDKTLIMHRIGLRIGVDVFKQEPAAGQWREAYRVSYWQLSAHDPHRTIKYSERKYFNEWPNVDEVAQQKQRLIDKGIPLTPPDGWMPESEEAQKLLKVPTATSPK